MMLPLPRNDLRQYDQLADEWWRGDGVFAMLHWLARARAALIAKADRPGAVLVDLGCGAGLLAPWVRPLGYQHVGVDLVTSALCLAERRGVRITQADVASLPLRDGCADVVCAGEILEHVPDPGTVIAEACRVLRPGGLFVADTLNATALARLIAVRVGERVPGIAPRGIHDPSLFVAPARVVEACARHGVAVQVRGLRPAAGELMRWLVTRRGTVRMVPTVSTAVLYQAWGIKSGGV
jgi:2-polyprenyl-6-hydroxyphenyl methylase/3-demethylubiquinone-9 3-methyltransferase